MKTYMVLCSVVEQDIEDQARLTLERKMLALYQEHFGQQVKIKVIWIEVPAGQAYQAGKPSNTATVLTSVENQLPPKQRVPFIENMCELWHQTTGKSKHNLVVSGADEERVKYVMNLSRNRVSGFRKVTVLMTMIRQLLVSKIKRRYLSMSINLNA